VNGQHSDKKSKNGKKGDDVPKIVQQKSEAVEKPKSVMTWGGGRTFADILKQEEEQKKQ